MAEEPRHPGDATLLLRRLAEGEESASGRLFPLVYAELRRLAQPARCW